MLQKFHLPLFQMSLLAFFTGIWWGCQLPELPDMWPLLILFLTGLLLPAWWVWRMITAAVAGLLWLSVYTHIWAPAGLPADLEGQTLEVQGIITSIPQRNRLYSRIDFQINRMTGGQDHWRGKVRLNWYKATTQLAAGQQWQLKVKLKRPHGFSNPGGFDYEAWLFQQGIAATGYVREAKTATLLGQRTTLNLLRQSLSEKIYKVLPENDMRGMLIALVVGDRQYISPEQWQALTRTGTIHLMAISGLHIGLVFGWLYFIGKWLWCRSARFCSLYPAQDAALIAGLLAATVYATLAGFSLPTQRALVMLSIIVCSLIARRATSNINILLLALIAVLLIDPFAVLSAAFWLSFIAVAMIFLYLRRQSSHESKLRHMVKIQFVIALGLAPVTLVLFQQLSLIAPVVNLVAVPVAGLLVVPLALTGALVLSIGLDPAAMILTLSSQVMQWLWQLIETMSQSDLSVLTFPQPSLYMVILSLLGVALLISVRAWYWRILATGLIALLFIPYSRWTDGADFQVDFLDVGQGLAIVVKTREHVMLYDTGFRANIRFDIGRQVIVPYLRHAGINHLDLVVLSHDDRDHVGGFNAVAGEISIGEVMFMPGTALAYPTKSSICQSGRQWLWDDVQFAVLYPLDEILKSENNRSCVIRISRGRHAVLLTGDIEAEAERQLSLKYGSKLNSTVMSSPHHGSATSSTMALLESVAARHVVHSAGYRNRFGFPHIEVRQRYEKQNTRQWRNDKHGMVRFTFFRGRAEPEIIAYRQTQDRFWRDKNQ